MSEALDAPPEAADALHAARDSNNSMMSFQTLRRAQDRRVSFPRQRKAPERKPLGFGASVV